MTKIKNLPRKVFVVIKGETTSLNAGAYLGGALGHGPPFGLPGLQSWGMPPPLYKLDIRLWVRNHLILGEKWDEIWVKTFFLLFTWFWRKMGRNLNVTISNSDLCSSQIFGSFWPPPPFSKSCVRYCLNAFLKAISFLKNGRIKK